MSEVSSGTGELTNISALDPNIRRAHEFYLRSLLHNDAKPAAANRTLPRDTIECQFVFSSLNYQISADCDTW